jgi:hypothetical protein
VATLIYLSGDSYYYPGEANCEYCIAKKLADSNSLAFLGQESFRHNDDFKGGWYKIPVRLNRLKNIIDLIADDVILVGRSSGGRVATLFAGNYQESILKRVVAVICLAYPFQEPNKLPEGSRYIHLADIKVPTLIIQGLNDEYGNVDIFDKYEFSKLIEFYFVDTDHEFNLSAKVLGDVLNKIIAFLNNRTVTLQSDLRPYILKITD